MHTQAVLLTGPRDLSVESLALTPPGAEDVVVEIAHSGISTGTEKLFWTGEMPPFPGMGYPLVPGYEAAGEVVEAGPLSGLKPGDHVFVPGGSCYDDAFGLFGGASAHIVSSATRVLKIDPGMGADGALLALAATARHAMAGLHRSPPDLVVGHGVLGRLIARLTIAAGAPAPTVWEVDPDRRGGATGYQVIDPEQDQRRNYACIFDASGQSDVLNTLIGRIEKGGEIVLAGFYAEPLSFAFPPAFIKEARLRVAAEWTAQDLTATRSLLDCGALSFDGLVTHTAPATSAATAYPTAFTDPGCLKMILNWKDAA